MTKSDAEKINEEFKALQVTITTQFKADLKTALRQAEGALNKEISNLDDQILDLEAKLSYWTKVVSTATMAQIFVLTLTHLLRRKAYAGAGLLAGALAFGVPVIGAALAVAAITPIGWIAILVCATSSRIFIISLPPKSVFSDL